MSDESTAKTGIGCVAGVLALMIQTPLYYILFYKILVRVDATPFMWVLFWIYLPVGVITAILREMVTSLFGSKK